MMRGFSSRGLCPERAYGGGFVQGGFVRRGFCPEGVLSARCADKTPSGQNPLHT